MDFVVMVGVGVDLRRRPSAVPLDRECVTKEVPRQTVVAAHRGSGVADDVVPTTSRPLDLAGRYLRLLPAATRREPRRPRRRDRRHAIQTSSSWSLRTRGRPYPDAAGRSSSVVDGAELLDVQPGYGRVDRDRARVLARRRRRGSPKPTHACWPAPSRRWPAARRPFLDVAGAFRLPCIFLADNPGVLAGTRPSARACFARTRAIFAMQHRLVAEDPVEAPQGLRVRLLDHGDEPVRRPSTVSLAFPA